MISSLDSAELKLRRAAEHLDAIKTCIAAYTAREPSLVTRKPDGKHRVSFWEPPPVEIALLAGEVVYQIRSALDHLAFDLVKLNPNKITLPKGWDKRCEFPLLLDIPTKGNPPIRWDRT